MEILAKLEQTANELLTKHNLNNWSFEFDNPQLRLGQCNYKKKVITISKRISLVLTFDEMLDTILHEIAHALTPGHKHDEIWKAKAIEIGCNGKQYASVNLDKAMAFKGTCPTCGKEIFAGKRTGSICVSCCNEDYRKTGNSNWSAHKFEWTKNM